jgi:hypothetical protein
MNSLGQRVAYPSTQSEKIKSIAYGRSKKKRDLNDPTLFFLSIPRVAHPFLYEIRKICFFPNSPSEEEKKGGSVRKPEKKLHKSPFFSLIKNISKSIKEKRRVQHPSSSFSS